MADCQETTAQIQGYNAPRFSTLPPQLEEVAGAIRHMIKSSDKAPVQPDTESGFVCTERRECGKNENEFITFEVS
jgi:hypothetical protein